MNSERTERGEVSTIIALATTFLFVAIVVGGVSVWLNSQISYRGAESIEETTRVAKCVFQLSAYRARYSEQARPPEVNTGQDPYAGLKLPTLGDIRRNYAANCQKYLAPFPDALAAIGRAQEGTP